MLIERLKAIVGDRGWTTNEADLEPHLTEWRDVLRGRTRIMLSPNTVEQVADIVRSCAAAGVAVVPQGGNTGLCGGAIPDESGEQILLSLSRLNRIRNIDAADFSMTVEAGCILANAQAAAEKVDRLFPLSLAAEGSCQIGGNLSTNAGGINALRYGTARQQVLGLEVVLANGDVLHGLRSVRKDTAGYDLKQLFIGSEGTLGIITAASLRLYPRVRDVGTVLVALRSARGAVDLLSFARGLFNDRLQAFELISQRSLDFVTRHIGQTRSPFDQQYPWYVLIDIEIAGEHSIIETLLEDALQSGEAADVIIAKNSTEAEEFWRLRHAISEAQKYEGASLKHDISVPIGKIGEFIERADAALRCLLPDVRPVIFGHVGDGNLHYNLTRPSEVSDADFMTKNASDLTNTLYELVSEFNGSISAEHGIGVLKREALANYRDETEVAIMRKLKHALDPQNLLNPGKVI